MPPPTPISNASVRPAGREVVIVIHDVNDLLLRRLVGPSFAEPLRVMPATVVTGARQTGKSTLARHETSGDRCYVSPDDLEVFDAARHDPDVLAAPRWRTL